MMEMLMDLLRGCVYFGFRIEVPEMPSRALGNLGALHLLFVPCSCCHHGVGRVMILKGFKTRHLALH